MDAAAAMDGILAIDGRCILDSALSWLNEILLAVGFTATRWANEDESGRATAEEEEDKGREMGSVLFSATGKAMGIDSGTPSVFDSDGSMLVKGGVRKVGCGVPGDERGTCPLLH